MKHLIINFQLGKPDAWFLTKGGRTKFFGGTYQLPETDEEWEFLSETLKTLTGSVVAPEEADAVDYYTRIGEELTKTIKSRISTIKFGPCVLTSPIVYMLGYQTACIVSICLTDNLPGLTDSVRSRFDFNVKDNRVNWVNYLLGCFDMKSIPLGNEISESFLGAMESDEADALGYVGGDESPSKATVVNENLILISQGYNLIPVVLAGNKVDNKDLFAQQVCDYINALFENDELILVTLSSAVMFVLTTDKPIFNLAGFHFIENVITYDPNMKNTKVVKTVLRQFGDS